MSVAQRLCDEIVEPVFRTPPNIFTTSRKCLYPRSASHKRCNLPYTGTGSTSRSIIIPKKRPSNKTLQREVVPTKSSLRSKGRYFEDLIYGKVLVNTAVNTIVTGPLKCDHDCVTDVRKRDNHNFGCNACNCSHRKLPNCKACEKKVQTVNTRNYLIADKACSRMIETMSCGTQFLESLCHVSRREREGRRNDKVHKHTMPELAELTAMQSGHAKVMEEPSTVLAQRTRMIVSSARRWALNNFPVHGPDF